MSSVSLREICGDENPIIGMVHFWVSSPSYRINQSKPSLFEFISNVRADINALQLGGADGLLFVNESDKPSRNPVGYDVYTWFSFVMGCIFDDVKIPFGIEVLSDHKAGVNLAGVFGAKFARGNFLGETSDPMNTLPGGYFTPNDSLDDNPQVGLYGNFDLNQYCNSESEISKIKSWIEIPDELSGLSISGLQISSCKNVYSRFKSTNPTKELILGSGVNLQNAQVLSQNADAMIVGSAFKEGGLLTNQVDVERVKEIVSSLRVKTQF